MGSNISLLYTSQNWLSQNRRKWQPVLIIAAVLAFVFVIATQATQNQLTLILMSMAGIAALALLLRQPNIGFFLVLLGGMFIPFSGPAGLNVAVMLVALMLVLWLLDMVFIKRRVQLVASRPIRPLLVFLLISFFALLMGQFNWFIFAGQVQAPLDAQLGGFAIFVLSGGAFLLAANLIKDLRWLKMLTWFFIAFGALYVFGRITPFKLQDRIYLRGFAAGSMFWTWLAALTFSQAYLNTHLRKRWRILLFVIVLATFYVAYVQANSWKSGWMPPLVAVAAIVAIRYWKQAILLLPLGLVVGYFLVTNAILTEEYSWGTRVDAWKIVTEITLVNPILGLGFANYYWYTPLFPIRGWRVNFNSHSQVVDIFAQTGVLGLLSFFWFLGELGILGLRLRDKVSDGFANAYVYGALGGLAGTLFAALLVDWVLPFVYNIGLRGFRASIVAWIFLGGLVSIEQITRGQAAQRNE